MTSKNNRVRSKKNTTSYVSNNFQQLRLVSPSSGSDHSLNNL